MLMSASHKESGLRVHQQTGPFDNIYIYIYIRIIDSFSPSATYHGPTFSPASELYKKNTTHTYPVHAYIMNHSTVIMRILSGGSSGGVAGSARLLVLKSAKLPNYCLMALLYLLLGI